MSVRSVLPFELRCLALLVDAPSVLEGMATRGPFEVDVVVIAAGFVGPQLSAALTRAGVTRGTVLEREPLPDSSRAIAALRAAGMAWMQTPLF